MPLPYSTGNEHHRRLEHAQLAEMRRDLTRTQQQIEIESAVHRETERFLKKFTEQLNERNLMWADKREQDLGERESALDQLKQSHARDEKRLREMEENYKKVGWAGLGWGRCQVVGGVTDDDEEDVHVCMCL